MISVVTIFKVKAQVPPHAVAQQNTYIYIYTRIGQRRLSAAPPSTIVAQKQCNGENVKVMTPTKRLRSAYIYIDKYSSRNCAIVVEWFGAHTYFGNGCGAVEIGGIGKGGSKASFESGGLFRDDVG